ncbi:MAG: hypothetical protein RRY34_03415 [Victivallaceae bacterium]
MKLNKDFFRTLRPFSGLAVMSLMLVLLCSCGLFKEKPSNNHLSSLDFPKHLERNGMDVESITPVDESEFEADEALAIKFVGEPREIGIYKFDRSRPKQNEKAEAIIKKGYVMNRGVRFTVKTNGSFFLIGVDENPHKEEITRIFQTFN